MESDSFMRIPSSLKSEVIYARDVVKAGLDVAVPLAPAALGAAVVILGVVWGTCEQARQRCLDAAHGVQAVRNAHWLEKHPIAYA